jgi:hypothetical protein
VSAALGSVNVEKGLTLGRSGGDGQHVAVVKAGVAGRQTVFMTPDSNAAYLYFQVDDGFYFERPQPVRIDVTYFDEGLDLIVLEYDAAPAASDWNADTMYSSVDLPVRTDPKQWLTASVELRDARFCGHQNGASDFRLATVNGQSLTVSQVVVTKLV